MNNLCVGIVYTIFIVRIRRFNLFLQLMEKILNGDGPHQGNNRVNPFGSFWEIDFLPSQLKVLPELLWKLFEVWRPQSSARTLSHRNFKIQMKGESSSWPFSLPCGFQTIINHIVTTYASLPLRVFLGKEEKDCRTRIMRRLLSGGGFCLRFASSSLGKHPRKTI